MSGKGAGQRVKAHQCWNNRLDFKCTAAAFNIQWKWTFRICQPVPPENYRMEMRVLPSERWFIILKLLLMREQNFHNCCLKQLEASKLPINIFFFFLGWQNVVKKSRAHHLRDLGFCNTVKEAQLRKRSHRTFLYPESTAEPAWLETSPFIIFSSSIFDNWNSSDHANSYRNSQIMQNTPTSEVPRSTNTFPSFKFILF